jgi:hypothetical protein
MHFFAALETVIQSDHEREWLLDLERRLCDDEITEDEVRVIL